MIRRDFNLIAGVIRRLPAQVSRDTLARALAEALCVTNRNFNGDRFLAACASESPSQTPTRRKRLSP